MTHSTQSALQDLKQGLTTRRRALINDAACRLIEAGAKLGKQWQPIAAALASNHEWTLSLAALDLFQTQAGAVAAAGYARANTLYRSGRFRDALAELDRLAEQGLGPATAEQILSDLNFRATIALLLDDRELARRYLTDALTRDRMSAQAWLTFSEVADFCGRDEAARAELERAFAKCTTASTDAMKLANAVGRMREQVRDHAGAMAAFKQGADVFRAALPGTPPSQPDLAALSLGYSPELIERVGKQITIRHDPVIFVSGLPRSGTTLVEQILVSHEDVVTGEELSFFTLLAQDIGGVDAVSFTRWLDNGGNPNSLVELYFHLASERFGEGVRFVDKTVEAGVYMGLILALFPRAPVFWMHRDPIDNGWSAFRTAFTGGVNWSWNLEEIGIRLAQEKRMIAHWTRTASNRIAFIDYERLVRDPCEVVPQIAAAAGLTLQEAMLRPHETKRKVTTASVSQVRQPINLKGLGVAAPYREWLGPMVQAFENGLVTDGSDVLA